MRLDVADGIIDAALKQADTLGLAPLAVVVLDAGGHLVSARRQDGAGLLRMDIAYAKAWGSLGMGFGSRALAQRAVQAPQFFAALNAVSGGRMAPSPGGVLVLQGDRLLGAVGVSGDLGDQDEACALAGVAAVSLTALPGEPG